MSRRLRIAYVCADRGVPVGGHKGASLHVAELVRALADGGADVRILAARVAEAGAANPGHGAVIDVGGNRSSRRAREALLQKDDRLQPSVATVEAAAVLFNHELGRALERLHRTEPVDAVYERYSLWSFAAAAFAKAQGLPFLLEVNAPLPEEQKRYRDLVNEALATALESYLFSAADHVLVPSAALVPYATSRGASPRSVHVVPNAADPSRFRPLRRRARKPGDEFTIGFVGSLKPWHGLGDLARAFRRLHRQWKGYRLLIVGDGPLRAELESQLAAWGLSSSVTFTGAADHELVPDWIARMDVAVAPYPADAPTYFSPIKLFEYMAAGTPVVASRVGQIAEFLTHRRSALLHAPGAISEMAEAIDELRRRPALGAKLAREGRSLVVKRYTWKRNAARVLALAAAGGAEPKKKAAAMTTKTVKPRRARAKAAAKVHPASRKRKPAPR